MAVAAGLARRFRQIFFSQLIIARKLPHPAPLGGGEKTVCQFSPVHLLFPPCMLCILVIRGAFLSCLWSGVCLQLYGTVQGNPIHAAGRSVSPSLLQGTFCRPDSPKGISYLIAGLSPRRLFCSRRNQWREESLRSSNPERWTMYLERSMHAPFSLASLDSVDFAARTARAAAEIRTTHDSSVSRSWENTER